MSVIGTAGHVDHGKSTLVQALTGIDPDRLREEKVRGLTIDLGFAWLTLPSGRDVSIVDVPGHERFIKNMLAGAGGVDLALLVVAADEGPMPQTREHVAILELLDVPAGVIALTKCDLVDEEYADLVEAELADQLAGTMLAGAPVVRVSARTGAGLQKLLACLDEALAALAPKRDLGRPRLPIDRAFTIQGFGTVVTGTLVDGALETGQEVEILPGALKARVRGLQRHKTKVARLEPGTRAAVNLSGVHADQIRRGMVLAAPGVLQPVVTVDVRLRATSILAHPLEHDAGLTFLSATAETEAKVRLLDRDSVGRSEEAWAQAVLSEPLALRRGDHCVLRSPNETVGGGVIVALNPRRHRRNHQPTLDALELQLAGSPAERLLESLAEGPIAPAAVPAVLSCTADEAAATVRDLVDSGKAKVEGGMLASVEWIAASVGRVERAIGAYLDANPLRAAAPREHVRSAVGLQPAAFDLAVAEGVSSGMFEGGSGGLAPAGYAVQLPRADRVEAEAFVAAVRAGGFSPPTDAVPRAALLSYLVDAGEVEDTGAGVVFARDVFDEMVRMTREHAAKGDTISMGEIRDLFGTSRKYAQAFLEHLDALHITRRVGDIRILRGGDIAP